MTDKVKPVSVVSMFILLSVLFSTAAFGQTFGQYDSRAVAMGGATVANANTAQAPFYNPALLSFHDDYEENTVSGRIIVPVIATRLSESLFDIEDYADSNDDRALRNAINAFNAAPNSQSATQVVQTAGDMRSILNNIDDRPLDGDVYFGLAISEPSKDEGGAFFLGIRALAGGRLNITDDDRALLGSYIDGLTFVASNGQQGSLRPEIFDGNGNLIDNTDNLSSSYRARGVTIVEMGVTFAKQVSLFSYPVAIGISPKLWIVETYTSAGNIRDGISDGDGENDKTEFSENLDIGLATTWGKNWQFGVVIKDVLTQRYSTALNETITIRPKARIGGAFIQPSYQFAIDIDLNRTDPFSTRQTSQDIALGAEWQWVPRLFLRAGYRYDIQSVRAAELSVGMGYQWRRLLVDLAYAEGSDSRAASLQLGYAF